MKVREIIWSPLSSIVFMYVSALQFWKAQVPPLRLPSNQSFRKGSSSAVQGYFFSHIMQEQGNCGSTSWQTKFAGSLYSGAEVLSWSFSLCGIARVQPKARNAIGRSNSKDIFILPRFQFQPKIFNSPSGFFLVQLRRFIETRIAALLELIESRCDLHVAVLPAAYRLALLALQGGYPRPVQKCLSLFPPPSSALP